METPACVIDPVWPAIVIDPDRRDVEPFERTENDTVPFPLPGDPPLMLMNAELLVAVHAQPEATLTLTVPDPPPEPKEAGVASPTV